MKREKIEKLKKITGVTERQLIESGLICENKKMVSTTIDKTDYEKLFMLSYSSDKKMSALVLDVLDENLLEINELLKLEQKNHKKKDIKTFSMLVPESKYKEIKKVCNRKYISVSRLFRLIIKKIVSKEGN